MNALPLSIPVAGLRRYGGESAVHSHDHAQVLFGLDGRLELQVGRRALRVEAGGGLVIPAGMDHGFVAPRGACVWVIDAPPAIGLDRVRPFALPAAWRPCADAAADLAAAAGGPPCGPRRALDVEGLRAVVDAALAEPWPTARLAALAHLSPARFHARWLAATGLTPQAWLRDLRLRRAQRLLRAGWPLQATAAEVGYARASALSHALRRDAGTGARRLRG